MNKETAKRRILELTLLEDWQENKEVVAEVQKLGKFLYGKESRGRKQKKSQFGIMAKFWFLAQLVSYRKS